LTQETWYANADALTASNPEEIISYTYNAAGDITSESDFNCAQSAVVSADYYTYNDADQLTGVVETIAGGPAVQLVYTYNDAGECSGVTASIGGSVDSSGDYSGGTLDYQNTYGYDANGDLTQIIQTGQTGGDAVATKEIDLTYNAAGQFQSVTRYENGQLVAESDYTYNTAGQLTGLVHEQGSSNVLASYAYTYGAGTALASAVQPVTPTVWTPSGATLPFDDPSQIDLSSLDQAPSPASLLASVTSVDGTATYSYDAMGQLTAASCTGAQPSESYSWDANGNPTGSGYVIGPDNELLSDGTYNYAYNADGDCTSRTDIATGAVTDYTWDARNRLVGVTDETSADQITQTVTYVYDLENRCVSETVTAYSGGNPTSVHTTDFAYDGNQIVLQFDATSAPGTPVSLTASNLSHRYLNGPAVDQVLADEQLAPVTGGGYDLTSPGNVVWTLADNEGTIRDLAVYNAQTGVTTVANHRIYDPFGKLISQTNPATGNAAAVDCLFGYTGCATDSNTDIEFHERRVKISGSPDWLSPDPINLTSGVTNLNDYCGNDPINGTDPSGLFDPAIHAAITNAALAGSGLSPRAISIIVEADVHQDDVLALDLRMPLLTDANHVDNSQFGAAAKLIQQRVQTALQRNSANLVLIEFGRIAHTIQDFYAHSNYVEYMDAKAGGTSTIGSIPIYPGLTDASSGVPPGLYSGIFAIWNPRTYSNWFGTAPKSHQALNKDNRFTPEGSTRNAVGVTYFALAQDLATRATRAAWDAFFAKLPVGMQELIKSI
jgi:RHS repeat-associated protein